MYEQTLEKRLSNKQGTRQLNNPGEKTTPLKEQLEVITAEKILITTTLTEKYVYVDSYVRIQPSACTLLHDLRRLYHWDTQQTTNLS